MDWETVIGLEIHAQLLTESKIFSAASTRFGAVPNTNACLVDLGYPGVLPVLNEGAVRMAVLFGLAVNAQVAKTSIFARKNYFYPDLPKGYQISQYELPIVGRGALVIQLDDGTEKTIGITRAHLEEDAGKSLHDGFVDTTSIDLNRAGVPLLEIVSEPDIRSPAEAVAYMKSIHTLVRYLGICDGNMQEGSFRCDANVSLRPRGSARLGTRTETKNLNSFRYLERAIEYEIGRQQEVLEAGGEIVQETRLYDSDRNETRSMRSKEEANDYRYFPDPDLLPLVLTEGYIEQRRLELPELPRARFLRFQTDYSLSEYDASVLTGDRRMADYYERVTALVGEPKLVANWVMGEVSASLNKDGLDITGSKVSEKSLAALLRRVTDRTLSGKMAKEVFEAMWESGLEADAIIEERGLTQISDERALSAAITLVLDSNPDQLRQYRDGKEKLFGFFVGQVMKQTKGKANPGEVNRLLKRMLQGS